MADMMPHMIWLSGMDMRCMYFNTLCILFAERTPEQELTMTWVDGVHLDDRQQCLGMSLDAFHGRRSFRIEPRLPRAYGKYRWILYSDMPWVTEEGGYVGYLGSCVDGTDLEATVLS